MAVSKMDIAEARKGGFKRKKPKKPKKSSSVTVWKNYEDRMQEWEREVKNAQKAYKDKERIMKKY